MTPSSPFTRPPHDARDDGADYRNGRWVMRSPVTACLEQHGGSHEVGGPQGQCISRGTAVGVGERMRLRTLIDSAVGADTAAPQFRDDPGSYSADLSPLVNFSHTQRLSFLAVRPAVRVVTLRHGEHHDSGSTQRVGPVTQGLGKDAHG